MLWLLFEIVINIFQGYLIQQFISGRMHHQQPHVLKDVLCIVTIAGYCSIPLFFPVQLPDVGVFIIPLVYAWSISKDRWYIPVYWTMVLSLLFLSIISLNLHLFSSVPGSDYDELMGKTTYRIVFVLTTNALLSLVVYLSGKLKKNYVPIHIPVYLLFLLANTGLFLVEESLYRIQVEMKFNTPNDQLIFFLAYIGLLGCTIILIILLHMMSESKDRENRYQEEINAINNSYQHQEELEHLYQNILTTKHDIKQHIQAMDEMIQQSESDQARHYLDEYKLYLSEANPLTTGATGLDALITVKAATMQKKGIDFQFSSYPLDSLPISEPKFCTIIGNLLDNAIEGCMQFTSRNNNNEKATIHLIFSRSWDMFYIYCKNSCNMETLVKAGNAWKTTKSSNQPNETHGIGIRSIERIVHAAEGRCSFQADNGLFTAKIVIPYTSEERHAAND